MEEQPVLNTATMKPEGVSGWEMELNHGRMPEQPANQWEEIGLSWKRKSYGNLQAVGLHSSNCYRPQTKLRKGNVFTPVRHSAHTGGGVHPPRQTHTPLGRHSLGRHPLSDTPPPHSSQAPRDGHCNGRYASYWNAFLLQE